MKTICVRASITLTVIAFLAGCQTAPEHAAAVQQGQTGDKLTLGTVQREILIGMPSADVVGVLGSPNMVTTDEQRNETWVYDKISTDRVSSSSSGGVNVLILGFGSAAGASSTSQRTLTIIVKFDGNSRVRDFAHRSSSF